MSFQTNIQQQIYLHQAQYDTNYFLYANNNTLKTTPNNNLAPNNYTYFAQIDLDDDFLPSATQENATTSRPAKRQKNSDIENERNEYCRVCGETRTIGYHHGAVTCEACKKFFERNAKGKCAQLKCNFDKGNCVVNKNTRNGCSFCRYQKCVSLGMSLDKTLQKDQSVKNLPCQVCSGPSSGIHFGAITCEGCKSFFKRIIDTPTAELHCLNKNNCEINFKYPKTCRACRFNRCLKVGMSQDKIKIGRQSNLFKNRLFSSENQSPNESLAQNIQPAEVDLDLETKNAIEMIHSAYASSMSLIQEVNLTNQPRNNCHMIITNFLQQHSYQSIQFIQKIEYFKLLSTKDQINLISNSIHVLRYLWISRLNKNQNYFNCDPETAKIIYELFPVFSKTDDDFVKLNDMVIKNLNLDAKEFSLFSALIVASASYQNGSSLSFKNIKFKISELLAKYMHSRRNESDSYQTLNSLILYFNGINVEIQKKICKDLIQLNVHHNFSVFFKSIYLRAAFLNNVQMKY